ncbi:MAG: hypothetical protein M1607_01710 [Patescibacteria group bacterium]|nr:hypothetical protein [Patescibacteria group bacterium]
MRKIFSGFLGLALVVAVVAGTAYAVFADTVTVSGVNISTATADLKINGTEDSLTLSGILDENIFPGYGVSGDKNTTFTLTNSSTGNFGLDISAKLTSAPGDWNALKDVVYVRVVDESLPYDTGWHLLSDWYAGDIPLTISPIGVGSTHTFRVYLQMPYNYPIGGTPIGNELKNKSITNVTFVITGTQH